MKGLDKRKFRKDIHTFVDRIVAYGENPADWPLTQQEQVGFIRQVMYNARIIKSSQEYLAESMEISSDELAMTT